MSQTNTPNTLIELESSAWRLQLEPDTGLQTRACQIRRAEAEPWVDIMPDCSASNATLKASNFHMLPYSNRLRDARFSFAGATYTLENAENHAIHGALRKRPCRVTASSPNCVEAEYDTRVDGAVNWPWPIRAVISYTLDNEKLISTMALSNLGTQHMPAGMGWHPYFCRRINGASPRLTFNANGVYPDTDGDCLPIGPAQALPTELDFSTARDLDPEQRIDHCMTGDFRQVLIAWPDAEIKVHMQSSDNCAHLVLYNPAEDYFAIEPVTNANNGFNLANKGIDAGVVELAPGETLTAQMVLTLA